MTIASAETSAWYQAMTLSERLASLRAVGGRVPDAQINLELAQRRFERWRAQPPFTNASHFAERLAMDGITEDELRHLLGETAEAIGQRVPAPPSWLMNLHQAYSRPAPPVRDLLPEESDKRETLNERAKFEREQAMGFLSVVEPLINHARVRVREGIQALSETYPKTPFDQATIERLLYANLPGQLITMLSRTMVLELNVARLRGGLGGETPEERFRSFFDSLSQRDRALALFQEYPVLARQLTLSLDRWVEVSLEFLQRLCADWEALRERLTPESEPGLLVGVDSGAGDKHRGGRSIWIARFESGFQVVYKPKSLGVDTHFQELLTWLNERGDHPPFRTLKVLERDGYGWVEFVAAESCAAADEVRRFYERQGGYLALLYALEATDFHFENLIAAGEHPVLIDLEALFHQRIDEMDLQQAEMLAGNVIASSVLRVGLLPQRIWSNAEAEGVELSGLGAASGQFTPQGMPSWEEAGTDEMHYVRKRMEIPAGRNRPTHNEADVNVLDYTDAILSGFTTVYRLLLEGRGELLADDGTLARFADDEVRVILRPTLTYGMLLHESFHPDVLRNALDRDRLFDRLWIAIDSRPFLAKIIPAERDDLQRGDVPMFTTRPGSRDLWTSSNERIADFFKESGLASVRRRVQGLSEEDLAQQLWFIRASLTTLAMNTERMQRPIHHVGEPQLIADREELLKAARVVGDRLEMLALRGEQKDVSWIGLQMTNERHWSLVPLGVDLYAGLPGVALFLAYLGAITGEERYTGLADSALRTLRRQLDRHQRFITGIGGFSGWGGIIYTLTHLAVLWDRPSLLAEAEGMVKRLAPLIDQDEQLDVLGGAAGCIAGLRCLYRHVPSAETLAAAIRCGDRLIARAQPMDQGIGWYTKSAGPIALTGFSHGAAGVSWALMELAVLSGEERFREAALAGMAYERSVFSREMGNWPDLRDQPRINPTVSDRQYTFMVAWCHGAPGIGLARLCALSHLDDASIRAEVSVAVNTTLSYDFGSNHSLCHGGLGNLELLLQAAHVLDDPFIHSQLNRTAATILESINLNGWLCGVPLGVEEPSLMTGIAGIGYELLRLAEPARVPSVLTLEPPLR